jgi:hypothetical protein
MNLGYTNLLATNSSVTQYLEAVVAGLMPAPKGGAHSWSWSCRPSIQKEFLQVQWAPSSSLPSASGGVAAASSSGGGRLGLGAERRWASGGAALAGGGLGAERRWASTAAGLAERRWVERSSAGGARGGEAWRRDWGLERWIRMDGGLCRGNPNVVGLGRFVGLGWAGVVHVGL